MHVYYRTLAGGRARAINVNIGCFVIIFYQKSGKVQKESSRTKRLDCSVSVPGGTRTPGLLVRSQALYPAELQAHTLTTNVIIAHGAQKVNVKRDN